MVYIRSSILGCFALFIILQPSLAWCSAPFFQAEATSALHHKSTQHDNQNELSPKMTFDVTLHGLLLWASLGFLMPVGTLIIRMSNRQECGTTVRVYFYFHLLVQMLAVMVATAGAIMSIKTLENAFNNSHQRVGLALYGAIWVQAVLGFCRPPRGSRKRSLWYFLHWILGTIICIVGIFNIYTGLKAYQRRTKRSVSLWTFLFTAEISLIAFFYLFQDKWDYLQKQGVVVLGELDGQIRPCDQETSQRDTDNNDMWRKPCSKANALKNLFH